MLSPLRDDALTSTPDGFALRLSLPWIRSLPLAALADVEVCIDGTPVQALTAVIGERSVTLSALAAERGWWFLQDRLPLSGRRTLAPGAHDVVASFTLMIPYLAHEPTSPLVLPFRAERLLVLDAPGPATDAARDVT